MVFSSLLFLFRFLPIMLVVYYCTPRRFRNAVLFGGSLVFYAWGEPVYIVLILFSILVAYCAGLRLSYYQKRENKPRTDLFLNNCLRSQSAFVRVL